MITDPRVKFPCLTLSIDYYIIVVHIIKCIIIWWLRTLLLSWTRAHDDRVCHLSSVNKSWLTFSGCQRILWQEIFSTEIDWRGSDFSSTRLWYCLWPCHSLANDWSSEMRKAIECRFGMDLSDFGCNLRSSSRHTITV